MATIALPVAPYARGLPRIVRSTSVSRSGNKAMAFLEYADPYWQIEMQTNEIPRELIPGVQAFIDEAGAGLKTVMFAPLYLEVPQAYLSNPSAAALSDTGSLTSITNGFNIIVGSVTNGLDLRRGDLISLATGDYRSLHRVMVNAVAAAASITLTVEPFIPPYIQTGATVRFKNLELNTRVLPGSDTITDDYLPVASWTLVEIPK